MMRELKMRLLKDLVMYLRNRQYKTVELNFYENNM